MELRFISSNKFKIEEVKKIFEKEGIEIIPADIKIEELQTEDTEKLVRDKLIKAFNKIGRPLFVEHTGLYIKYLGGFPGGLTQIFWDSLKADKFTELLSNVDRETIARTVIGYCDGKKIELFEGEIKGTISDEPKGNRDFQWDCVFIPENYTNTFAELGPDVKNTISMRKIAMDKLLQRLKS